MPLSDWLTISEGAYPPPELKPIGMVCPKGEEGNTQEHQLAKWAIENELVELGLEHHEIVEKSSDLLHFLARMCHKFDWLSGDGSITDMNNTLNEHLLFVSDSCSQITDVMVVSRLYSLLLSLSLQARDP